MQSLSVSIELAATGNLWKGEARIPLLPAKARIARRRATLLYRLDTAKEGFEGKFNPHGDVLQNLCVDPGQSDPFRFQRRQTRLLVIKSVGCLAFLPSSFAFCEEVIVQPAALLKLLSEEALLLLIGQETIFERLQHTCSVC